jgi:hypothetical protein
MHRLVVNKAAIARLFGIPAKRITRVEATPHGYAYFLDGAIYSTGVIPTAALADEFIGFRQAAAETLPEPRRITRTEWAIGSAKRGEYYLEVQADAIACTCEDYTAQEGIPPEMRACKHGYRLLAALGFGGMGEYLGAIAKAS